jgi:hypothetical protein
MRVGIFCESGWSQELKLFFMAGLFQILLFYRPVLLDEWICIESINNELNVPVMCLMS